MFTIQGKVVAKESGAGVPGLVVHAFDIDAPVTNQGQTAAAKNSPELAFDTAGGFDSLGSVLTTEDGSFSIRFEAEDFNVSGKDLRPEILLLVTRPEDAKDKATSLQERALHTSTPIRYKAGKTESFHIRIAQAEIDRFGLRLGGAAQSATLLQQISARAAASKAMSTGIGKIRKRVDERVARDFANFNLSRLSTTIRSSDTYLLPGQDLVAKQTRLIDNRLAALGATPARKRMTLRYTEADLIRMGLWRNGPVAGPLAPEVVDGAYGGTALERLEAHMCMQPFSEADLDDPAPGPTPVPSPDAPTPSPSASIAAQVNAQLATAVSPETALRYERVVDPAYKTSEVCDTIGRLSLCGGPADVTSYHDFQSIQIAFEHVWTELFDKHLVGLGHTLYTEAVKTAEGYTESHTVNTTVIEPTYTTIAGMQVPFGFTTRVEPREVATVDDLRQLIADFEPAALNNEYIGGLVREIQERLSSAYKFEVFAPNSINYGVVFTFRQKWEPANYQVGRLVSSLPLAPKEIRRYSTRVNTQRSRNDRFLDDREFRGKSESTVTSRAESEIIKRASNNTSFGVNTHASVNMEMFSAGVDTSMTAQSERFSQETKRNFREAVMNSVEEYRRQNKTEVEFSARDETTNETSGEISNPNDEITVTYLFYELQRQYDISEELHKVQPVIMVANEVPTPDQIDDDWMMANAWILKRVILDEAFIPTLNRLTASSIGDNLALTNLKNSLGKQERLINALIKQIESKNSLVDHLFGELQNITIGEQTMQTAKDVTDMVRGFVDPIGSLLGGLGGGGDAPTFERVKDMLQMAMERAEKETKDLSSQLTREQSHLQALTEKYNKEIQEYFDRQTANAQLRMHLKDNILYYMQAIWDYEPPDQRYFRLYNLDVDWFEPVAPPAPAEARPIRITPGPGGYFEYEFSLAPFIRRDPAAVKRKLVQVADLDRLLGYKGNYMVFPVREANYLHKYMMQEFVDNATGGLRDADRFANQTTQQLIDYLKCLRRENPAAYARERDTVLTLINERLTLPRKEKERVIIPTNSLYIEALPGKHPVMEDFKLAHRALDVKKVQAEVRTVELENLRRAARLLEGEREDPDVDTRIEVTGGTPIVVPTER